MDSKFFKIAAAACTLGLLGIVWHRQAVTPAQVEGVKRALPASGAEDADLFTVRAAALHHFTTLYRAATLAPHTAALGARFVGGLAAKPAGALAIDVVVFGADEALAKSPYNAALAIFAPGVLAAKYASHFLDTNPWAAASLIFMLVVADITWWMRIVFGATVSVVGAIEGHLVSLAVCSLIVSVEHAANYVAIRWTSHAVINGFFYIGLVFGPFLSALQLFRFVSLLRTALKSGGRWGVVDAAKRADIAAAIAVADDKLLTPGLVTKRYRLGRQIGEGGFGRVCEGASISSGEAIAIKFMTVSEPPSLAVLLLKVVLAGVQGGPEAGLDGEKAVRAMLKLKDDTARMMAMHEVRGLLAARMSLNGSIISLRTAHEHDNGSSVAIVTQLAGPSWLDALKDKPISTKIKSLKLALTALADLHSAGIVHRDIKPANISTALGDPSVPIILDLGIALLPGAPDLFSHAFTVPYVSPEHAIMLKLESGATVNAGSAASGAPGDVWAMAVTFLDIIAGGEPVMVSYAAMQAMRAGVAANKFGVSEIFSTIAGWSPDDSTAIIRAHGVTVPSALADLLTSMLNPDPAMRTTARDAARHHVFGAPTQADLERAAVHSLDAQGIATRLAAFLGMRRQPNVSRLALLRNALARAAAVEGGARARGAVADVLPRLRAAVRSLGGAAMHVDAAGFAALVAAAGLSKALPLEHAELFDLLDEQRRGQLDKRQALMGLAFVLTPLCDERTRLRLAFDAFDLDGSGSLSISELRDFFEHFGPTFASDAGGAEALRALSALQRDSAALFERLDADHDGSVSFEEFEAGVHRMRDLRTALFGSDDGAAGEGDGRAGGAVASPAGAGAGGAAANPRMPVRRVAGKAK